MIRQIIALFQCDRQQCLLVMGLGVLQVSLMMWLIGSVNMLVLNLSEFSIKYYAILLLVLALYLSVNHYGERYFSRLIDRHQVAVSPLLLSQLAIVLGGSIYLCYLSLPLALVSVGLSVIGIFYLSVTKNTVYRGTFLTVILIAVTVLLSQLFWVEAIDILPAYIIAILMMKSPIDWMITHYS